MKVIELNRIILLKNKKTGEFRHVSATEAECTPESIVKMFNIKVRKDKFYGVFNTWIDSNSASNLLQVEYDRRMGLEDGKEGN